MHTRNILSLLAAAALCTVAQAQVSVFTDSFTNLSNWTTSVSAGDGGASVVGGVAILTNDASGTTNLAGRVSIVTATSAFSNGFDQVLSNNAGDTTWTFNMRQIRSDPAGFGAASYGVGFILGSTSSNLFTGGNGYAVVLGQSGSTDAVRLVSFTGGLAGTLTNIITATAPLADVGADYLSLQVGYNSTTNLWSLFGRNDGASTFTAPATGSLSALGTATNTTYTSATLTHMGAYWGYSTAANQTASFDNVSVAISAIPEPSTYAAIFGGLALVGAVVYRRRQAKA